MSNKPKTITEPTELSYLKIFAKQIKTEEGVSFTRYFAYVCDENWNDVLKTIKDKDTGLEKVIPTSIGVRFTPDCLTKINFNKVEFPVHMTLTDDMYFITIDKDAKTKKPKLRNDGTKVDVCVIMDYNTIDHFETPKTKLSDLAK